MFDFLNGADPTAFLEDGLLNLNTFFNVSNGDPFGLDFDLANIFQDDTFSLNVPGEPISGFDPATGALEFADGDIFSAVPEPNSLLIMITGLAAFGSLAGWRRACAKRAAVLAG